MAPTLYDFFSNSLLLYHTAPYLSLRSICALIRTDKSLRSLLINNGSLYRYLDLQEVLPRMVRWASRNKVHRLVKSVSLAENKPGLCNRCADNSFRAGASDASAIDVILKDGNDGRIAHSSAVSPILSKNCLVDKCIDDTPSKVAEITRFPKRSLDELGDYNSLYSLDVDEWMRIVNNFRSLQHYSDLTYDEGLPDGFFQSATTATSIMGKWSAWYGGKRLSMERSSAVELSLVNTVYLRAVLCIYLNKQGTGQLCQIQRKQDLIIYHVRMLILDGIRLGHSTIITDILKLVKQRKICLRLLSLRQTDISQNDHTARDISAALELTDPGFDSDEEAPHYYNLRPALGIYLFGRKEQYETQSRRRFHRDAFADSRNNTNDGTVTNSDDDKGIMSSPGAQLGSEGQDQQQQRLNGNPVNDPLNSQSRFSIPDNKWYQPTGIIDFGDVSSLWPGILQKLNSSGDNPMPAIAFDAVLCRGPRHDPAWLEGLFAREENGSETASEKNRKKRKRWGYVGPRLAKIALGPSGCVDCGTSPEGPASFPDSPISHLPLLSLVPRFDGSVRNAQRPPEPSRPRTRSENTMVANADANACAFRNQNPRLIVRCTVCLDGRWCEKCNRWWCEDCYAYGSQRMKVVDGLCVERCLVAEMMNGAGSGGMWG